MPIPERALELENRSIGIDGEATLAAAYYLMKEQWQSGDRDRELGLHLFFLAWFGLIEPENITGFSENEDLTRELNETLSEVHDYFEPKIYGAAEMLYVIGLAAHMFWDSFYNPYVWERRAREYQRGYRSLSPNGIEPAIFQNRGAYGVYYAGHATLKDGY